MDNKYNQTLLKVYKFGGDPYNFFLGDLKPMTFESKWFIKNIANWKASNQYVIGIDALTRRLKTSFTNMSMLSYKRAIVFMLWGQKIRWVILDVENKDRNGLNSLGPSIW